MGNLWALQARWLSFHYLIQFLIQEKALEQVQELVPAVELPASAFPCPCPFPCLACEVDQWAGLLHVERLHDGFPYGEPLHGEFLHGEFPHGALLSVALQEARFERLFVETRKGQATLS